MPPPLRAARFGNVAGARERFHEARHLIGFEQFARDLRYGWRGLWRSRAFLASTVLTLAVGLGLVTSVFAVFNAYVLRPFAVRDPYGLYESIWRAQDAAGGRPSAGATTRRSAPATICSRRQSPRPPAS